MNTTQAKGATSLPVFLLDVRMKRVVNIFRTEINAETLRPKYCGVVSEVVLRAVCLARHRPPGHMVGWSGVDTVTTPLPHLKSSRSNDNLYFLFFTVH